MKKTLTHKVELHPQYFGHKVREHLNRKLHEDVEGKVDGKFGYIVCVLDIIDISKGLLIPSRGVAEFNVVYNALILKVFKNMVVDGIVTMVNKVCAIIFEGMEFY